MRTVYRLEMPNEMPVGFGPYSRDVDFLPEEQEILDQMEQEHCPDGWDEYGYRPGLFHDYIEGEIHSPGYSANKVFYQTGYSACPDLDTLYWWFAGYLDYLMEMGFEVVEYVVQKALDGRSGKQVLFLEEDIIESEILTKF